MTEQTDRDSTSPDPSSTRAHPHQRLTTLRVKAIKHAGRYTDGNGLYLVVNPSGAKQWLLRTVVRGKRCDLGLGSVRLVSLADARAEASRLRKIARDGGDPLAERRRARAIVPTFKDAAKQVHAKHAATFRNIKHKADWIGSLERYAFPVVGDRAIDTLTSADVLKVLTPIWSTKPETARRVKQRLRTIIAWAKAAGFFSGENPVDTIAHALPKLRPDQKRKTHFAALPYVQVPKFVETLREAEAATAVKLAFEFVILTAARTSEVLGARWDEIDCDTSAWTIPGRRIKAGREHRVPLSPRCLELLDQAAAIRDGGPFVFPGRYVGRPLSGMAMLMLLRRLKRTDITVHGFRSSFRDWCAERTNFPRAVVEAALAHVVENKVEAAYFRSDLFDKRRSLMDTWAAFATTKTADVVALRA
jgi:integrase